MALLERVATLIRANINDLVDKAEDPEKVIKQIILDMQNQLLQVKTQVAIAIADQHLLEKKQKENEEKNVEWQRKAELAVSKKEDDMARGALERALSYKQIAESFTQQVADQKTQVDNLRSALNKLEQKLAEAQNRSDMLVAQQRRARVVGKASDAHMKMTDPLSTAGFDRMKNKVMRTDAVSQAKAEMVGSDSLDDKFARLEKEDEIERLLQEMKSRQGMSA